MIETWIIVADSAHARVFTQSKQHTQLEEINTFIHPAGRQREVDQQTDRPGRSFDSSGSGRHAMEPHTDWKRKESDKFSRELSAYLTEQAGQFADLIIISPPEFLGLLRSCLDDIVSNRITRVISKNMVHLDKEAIRANIYNEKQKD
jgi:protein required for attachment to host cells